MLVRIFNCDFDSKRVMKVVIKDGVVKARAVAPSLKRGKDDELRDSGTAREGGFGWRGERKCEVKGCWMGDALF